MCAPRQPRARARSLTRHTLPSPRTSASVRTSARHTLQIMHTCELTAACCSPAFFPAEWTPTTTSRTSAPISSTDDPASYSHARARVRSPFKKPERQNDARIKWTIGTRFLCRSLASTHASHDAPRARAGVLLALGLLAFWMHRSPDSFDQREAAYEAPTVLRPIVGAATTPHGGGMAAGEAAPTAGTDAAAAAMGSAQPSSRRQQQQPAAAGGASGGANATASVNRTSRR